MMLIFISIQNDSKMKRGFSLIELLISVSLLGLVLILLYGAFSQISNLSIQVKSNLNSREQLRLIMKIVIDDLQKIQYLKYFAESEKKDASRRQTGMIAERITGPTNPETGEIEITSTINFHAAINSRFYPSEKVTDPGLHEIGYYLEENQDTETWDFIRREDFYVDSDIKEGGKKQILSQEVTKFDLEFLESETALAGGGFVEKWVKEWNSDEYECGDPNVKENFCLPRAFKLTMSLKGEDEKTIFDSQVANLCIPPCNPELFE